MNKIRNVLIATSILLFTACSTADFNNFLGDLNKSLESITNTKGSEFTQGEHYHYIKLNGNSYYSTSELEMKITYYNPVYQGSNYQVVCDINGKIYSKVGEPLTAIVYFPIVNSDGNILRKFKEEFVSSPYDAININMYRSEYTSRKGYIPKDNVIIGIYNSKGQMVGTNRPELFEKEKTTTTKSATKTTTVKKEASKKTTTTKKAPVKRTRQTL